MRTLLFVCSILFAPSAFAGSLVFWRVPDVATVTVEGADAHLGSYRDAVADRRAAADHVWSEVEDDRSRRRAAYHTLHERRGAVREADAELRRAVREGADEATVVSLRDAQIRAIRARDTAEERLASRNLDVDAARAEYRVAIARQRHADAELELRQATLLDDREARIAWMYRPSRFVRQVERVDRAIERTDAEYDVAVAIAEDSRRDFVAAN